MKNVVTTKELKDGVCATDSCGNSITVAPIHGVPFMDHLEAFKALAHKLNWPASYYEPGLLSSAGNAYVFVPVNECGGKFVAP